MVYRRVYVCAFAYMCIIMWVLEKPQLWFNFHPVQLYKMIKIFNGYVIKITSFAIGEDKNM